MRIRPLATMAVLAAAALTLSACGGDDSTPAASGGSSSAVAPTSSAPMATPSADSGTPMTFGAGCAAVPTSGKGSFSGMATDPVATAGSHTLAVRATDRSGQTQVEQRTSPFPSGSTGWHSVVVTVS